MFFLGLYIFLYLSPDLSWSKIFFIENSCFSSWWCQVAETAALQVNALLQKTDRQIQKMWDNGMIQTQAKDQAINRLKKARTRIQTPEYEVCVRMCVSHTQLYTVYNLHWNENLAYSSSVRCDPWFSDPNDLNNGRIDGAGAWTDNLLKSSPGSLNHQPLLSIIHLGIEYLPLD